MQLKCSVITDRIKELAKGLSRSPEYTNNLVSAWQTTNKSVEYPSLEQLKEFGKTKDSYEVYLATPVYENIPYTEGSIPIKTLKNGEIYLVKFPHENPMEYFYSKFDTDGTLKKEIQSTNLAYRYILWREMAFIELGSKTKENEKAANEEALKKVKLYKEHHPEENNIKIIKVDTKKKEADVEFPSNLSFSISDFTGYPQRTAENADWSDITLAFAIDFTTAGERLTAQQAGSQDKNYLGSKSPLSKPNKYIPTTIIVDKNTNKAMISTLDASKAANEIFAQIEAMKLPKDNIKLNIAGNSITTLSKHTTQDKVDAFITEVIKILQKKGVTINTIRSGGQTGIDEAGIKAAINLGIKADVHAPKDWKFRDANGKDYANEEAFKARFKVVKEGKSERVRPSASTQIPKGMFIKEYKGEKYLTYQRYNSADDTDFTRFYRLKDGKLQVSPNWTSDIEEGKDLEWKEINLEESGNKFDEIEGYLMGLEEEEKDASSNQALISIRGIDNPYRKEDPTKEPDTAFVFTENTQAYTATHRYMAEKTSDNLISESTSDNTTLWVKDYADTDKPNTAGIRSLDGKTQQPNVFGIVVKKYQHLRKNGSRAFAHSEGNFQDTDEDLELFKLYNEDFFKKLDAFMASHNGKVVFPSSIAMGRAALPERFINWIQNELRQRYNLNTTKAYNKQYGGWGLQIESPISSSLRPSTLSREEVIKRGEALDVSGLDDYFSQQEEGIMLEDSSLDSPISAPEAVLPQQEYQAVNVDNLPPVGTDVLNIDMDNPIAKLARDFSAIEKRDRVQMIARAFSNQVDGMVKSKISETKDAIMAEMAKKSPDIDKVEKLQNDLQIYLDSVKGRRAVIEAVTVKTLFDNIREEFESYAEMTPEEFDEDYGEGQGERMQDAYRRIVENFDLLLKEACVIIEGTENMRIDIQSHSYNDGKNTTEVLGGTIQDTSDETQNDEDNFNDDENGNRADGNGGWSFHVRFVDPYSSLSANSKRVLANIIKVDSKGTPEVDDLGYTRYLSSEYAHSVLMNELSSMVDADDFSQKLDDGNFRLFALERIRDKYPWVSQIMSALQSNPKLISSFYADFRKDFIAYWMQKDGKTFPMNSPVAEESTLNRIVANYERGTTLDENSIYTSGHLVKKENAEVGIDLANNCLNILREAEDGLEDTEYDELIESLNKGFRMVGLDTNLHIINSLLSSPEELISMEKAVYAMRDIFEGLKEMPEESHLIDFFRDEYKTIAKILGEVSELDYVQSFRQGDKSYYSYSAPNYLDTEFKIFKNDDRRDNYLEEQFKRYEWFYNSRKKEWKNEWLKLIETDEDVRAKLELKDLNILSTTRTDMLGNVTGTNDVEYTEWTPDMIRESFVLEYFSAGYNKGAKKQFAWYNFPIFSDSPISKFVKFLRYTGDFKEQIIPLLGNVVKQELFRINLVEQRNELGVSKISNFDKNGNKFHFFPKLNSLRVSDFMYNEDSTLFLDKIKELTNKKESEQIDILINNAVSYIMESEFNKFLNNYETSGVKDSLATKLVSQGVITKAEQLDEALEEYFWNQSFATSQIIQITTTDLAYYKNGVDFQKRYKEVYAAGTKLNTNSEFGRKYEKTIYLKDQVITSAKYSDIKRVLDNAVSKNLIKGYDRDSILNKFKDINVADAQAFRSLSSFRAILDMMGAWTDEMQAAFDRIKQGKWDMSDFNIVWQTIKPFVFTQIEKSSGVKNKTYDENGKVIDSNEDILMKVPHQNKNSEFLLLTMYQILSSSLESSGKMRAINQYMEDNDIDVIQFESAVKAGGQGTINLSYSPAKVQTFLINNSKIDKLLRGRNADKMVASLANSLQYGDLTSKEANNLIQAEYNRSITFDELKEYYDSLLDQSKISQEEYNSIMDSFEPSYKETLDTLNEFTKEKNGEFKPNVVHNIPYSDYVVQQPTPEHIFDATAVFGSQFRNLIISDMPNDPNFRVNIHGRELTKQQVLDLYQSIVVENLLEDFGKVRDKFKDIESLQKAMLQQVNGNPKYGSDMVNALQIVEITNPISGKKEKVFNIPLNNPSTTKKIQELVDSMFKNGITKQYIHGGACILVSNFGYTKELNILFKDSEGNVIDRSWFEKNAKSKGITKSYEEWAKETLNKGEISIAGMECYLPAYSKRFYAPFMVTKIDSEGNEYQELDVNKMPEELRKIIGYRIPTEDKYSMAPLIVKGFLPQQNGSAIMVPADITQIAGSDFDKHQC